MFCRSFCLSQGGIEHLERTRRYHTFRRDHMGDQNIDDAGEMKSRWMTHPPTESRLVELRDIVEELRSRGEEGGESAMPATG